MDKKYDSTNRGFLFRAEERRNDRSPEYTGTLNIMGKEYRLSAWIKESKAGKKYFSLSVVSPALTPKKVEKPAEPLETTMMDDLDSLPF
jgi:uncharacterized protein (DUF736 family)